MSRESLTSILTVIALTLVSITSFAQSRPPKTVREFFNLLPQIYFPLEGCSANPAKKNCDKARTDYLKHFLKIEDTTNGYMEGGCDGAQSCFHMALFRRPNGNYIVGITTSQEDNEDSSFLEYSGGKWHDIGKQVIPEYGKDKVYDLPQYGTTIEAYEYNKVAGEDYRQRGRKLYNIIWKDGRFIKK